MYSPQFILKTDKQKIHEVVLLPCSVEFSHVDFLRQYLYMQKALLLDIKCSFYLMIDRYCSIVSCPLFCADHFFFGLKI